MNIDPADQVGLWSFTPAIVSTHNQVIKQASWHSYLKKSIFVYKNHKDPELFNF